MSDITTTNWSSNRLKDISAINLCVLPANTADDFTFRYLEISNVNNYGVISDDAMESLQFADAPSRARRIVKTGDILVSSVRPNLQAIAHADWMLEEPLVCSTGFNVVSPRLEKVSDRLLYYFLLSEGTRQRFEAVAKGVGYPAIDDKDFCTTDVPLPPFPEQKRIAAYLDASCAAIDRAVETKQKQLDTLNALRKSIIQKTVTQGLNPKVRMKVVPMDGVGLAPVHWRVKQLRYCCQISYGITLQLESGKTDGVRILTVQNLDIHGDWKFDQEFCIDEELVKEGDILRHGDLLFNWRNGSARHVGKTAFFDLEGRYTHVSFLLRMRCGKELSPFYLKSYLGALRMAGFFEGSKDKVNKTFNSTELNRLSVLVPPIEEQERIVAVVQKKWSEIEDVLKVIKNQISTLTAYRKSLIHECVTGKRRITDADLAKVGAHV